MTTEITIAIDLVAIFILTIALYYRRHRRRDLVTAYAVLNVGVFAVSSGLGSGNPLGAGTLIAPILVVVAIVDARGVLPSSRQQDIRLDRAFMDEGELRAHLSTLLGGTVTNLRVISVNLVNDSTLVDVRWVTKAPSKAKQ